MPVPLVDMASWTEDEKARFRAELRREFRERWRERLWKYDKRRES